MTSLGQALIQYDWCPFKIKFELRHVQKKDLVKTQGERRRPETEASERTNLADALFLFQLPEL